MATKDYQTLIQEISNDAWKIRDLVEELDRETDNYGIAFTQEQKNAREARLKELVKEVKKAKFDLLHPTVEQGETLSKKQEILKTVGQELDAEVGV